MRIGLDINQAKAEERRLKDEIVRIADIVPKNAEEDYENDIMIRRLEFELDRVQVYMKRAFDLPGK